MLDAHRRSIVRPTHLSFSAHQDAVVKVWATKDARSSVEADDQEDAAPPMNGIEMQSHS